MLACFIAFAAGLAVGVIYHAIVAKYAAKARAEADQLKLDADIAARKLSEKL